MLNRVDTARCGCALKRAGGECAEEREGAGSTTEQRDPPASQLN